MTAVCRSALTTEALPESLPKLFVNQVGDGIQPPKQHDPKYAMAFRNNAQSRADLLRRVFVKVRRTNQVREMSVHIIVLLCDLASLFYDLPLRNPRCFRSVHLNHKLHISQTLANVSRILRLATRSQHLCRTSHDSVVTPYLVSLIDYNVNGGKGR